MLISKLNLFVIKYLIFSLISLLHYPISSPQVFASTSYELKSVDSPSSSWWEYLKSMFGGKQEKAPNKKDNTTTTPSESRTTTPTEIKTVEINTSSNPPETEQPILPSVNNDSNQRLDIPNLPPMPDSPQTQSQSLNSTSVQDEKASIPDTMLLNSNDRQKLDIPDLPPVEDSPKIQPQPINTNSIDNDKLSLPDMPSINNGGQQSDIPNFPLMPDSPQTQHQSLDENSTENNKLILPSTSSVNNNEQKLDIPDLPPITDLPKAQPKSLTSTSTQGDRSSTLDPTLLNSNDKQNLDSTYPSEVPNIPKNSDTSQALPQQPNQINLPELPSSNQDNASSSAKGPLNNLPLSKKTEAKNNPDVNSPHLGNASPNNIDLPILPNSLTPKIDDNSQNKPVDNLDVTSNNSLVNSEKVNKSSDTSSTINEANASRVSSVQNLDTESKKQNSTNLKITAKQDNHPKIQRSHSSNNNFVKSEIKYLLKDEDVALDKLSDTGKMAMLEISSYIDIFWLSRKHTKDRILRRDLSNLVKYNVAQKHNLNCLRKTDFDLQGLAFNNSLLAIKTNDLNKLRTMLDFYPILQSTTSSGESLLHKAIEYKNYSMAKFLIVKGVNIDSRNSFGETALDIIKESNNRNLMNLLIYSSISK